MKTFSVFFKILKARGSALVIYLIVFGAIALVMGGTGGGAQGEFAATSLNVGVVNRDNHPISAALVDYLHELHNVSYLQDSYILIEDEVFFERVHFALIIDDGFGIAASTGTDAELLRYLVAPDTTAAEIFITRQVDAFLQNLSAYMAAGFSYDDALPLVVQDMQERVHVSVMEGSLQISFFFNMTVFIITALVITVLAPTLVIFKEKERFNRLAISATSRRKRTAWLIAASLVSVVAVWAGVMLIANFFHHESLLSFRGSLQLLNAFIFAMVIAGFAVFLSALTRNQEAIEGATTLTSVLLSFTGGAFVPVAVFSDTMRTIAQFSPSFWFNHANQVIYDSIFTGVLDNNQLMWGLGIQLAFALAFFSLALVVGKDKAE